MARIRIDGSWFEWPRNTISQQEIRDFMLGQGFGDRYGATRKFTYTSKNTKSPELVPDSPTPVESNAVVQLTSLPANIIYGADLSILHNEEALKKLSIREKFILAQVFQISERYCSKNNNAVSLHRNGDFVVIRDFPLPFRGDWVGRSATICFHFPLNYPHKPPVGYFIDGSLQHRGDGERHLFQGGGYREPKAFFDKHNLGQKGYGYFCWHVEENWRPDLSNPLKPDNLNSFLASATLSLDSDAVNQVRKIGMIS